MTLKFTACIALAALIIQGSANAITNPTDPVTDRFTVIEPGEHLPGGSTTYTGKTDRNVFSQPAANISFNQRMEFRLGDSIFRKLWVSSPSSTTASDGLGPLYNARSCEGCHIRDGRGHPPESNWPDDNAVSMLLRLSIPPQDSEQQKLLDSGRAGVIPEPTYGEQLQDFAVTGLAAEGRMQISYSEHPVTLADGTQVRLQKPTYRITGLNYGSLHPETMISPRVAPAMIGLGLLEAIPEQTILALADPDDKNQDGISGRPNQVWDRENNRPALGRFGWKAGNPTLNQQNNGAFNGDIGISTPTRSSVWGDCTEQQPDCLQQPHGNTPAQDNREASQAMVKMLLFYTRNLAVPVRRGADKPEVLAGKQLFHQSGCAQCHEPSYQTGQRADMPGQSNQLIWPYTDLLLHDMGEGLADNRPEYAADGREWKTPPLWGIGLTRIVSGHSRFLHDGRARNLLEAILWHGGEAEQARQAVIDMNATDRKYLISFLESL